MIITDIIALAKAGYTPKDVKDLIALDKAESAEEPKAEGAEEPKAESAEEPEAEGTEEPKAEGADIIDYQAKVAELERKIADMQKENTSKDISKDKKDTEDVLKELVRAYM